MGSVNSHFMNTEHSDQLLRQESTIIGDNTKIDDLNTKLNESMIYTGFWHRLFKKSKTLDNEPPHLNSNILNDQQNKSNIQSNDDSLQNNVAYQHTTNKLLTTDKTVISKPISIDSNELRNNTKLFEHKYSSEYGQHHQFQITSLSNRKQRLLHLNQSPKMRFIRKLNTFASVPDLTKKPIRSALKDNQEDLEDHEGFMVTSNEVNLSPDHQMNDDIIINNDIKEDDNDDEENEHIVEDSKSSTPRFHSKSTIYTEGMTQEMFMLRFSEFVEVQELEPCDRSADKPWIRLTSKDKVIQIIKIPKNLENSS
ncbi:hypothetical protein Smp_164020 [Schistosoma mansoni]|uniref:hypothetical protein n=1 Tax=Schistosoma mansoni TaxID=6183 RepID=UPI0001A623A4|nr:hypothetical protein Smp_164020 [Schistosoma mansoni]|eukprot:XP_018653451.1 hypothetical protein Smp_164020 [Schistosoma mansoni]